MKSGFFCIDKPEGITSHDVVSRMRRILDIRKVGHSGTLDPMATGVLIIGCGTSTRLLDYVQSGTKQYVADIRFGMKTTTGDSQGETVELADMSCLDKASLCRVINDFIGEIQQIPPMVSAVKVDGKKLYEYQREGMEIERDPRKVYIESIVVEDFVEGANGSYPEAKLTVTCGAGTYIRTLAEDIAQSLDGFAYLTALRRTRNGNISEDQCVSLEVLNASSDPYEYMVDPGVALSHLAIVELTDMQTLETSHGKPLELEPNQMESALSKNKDVFLVEGTSPRHLVGVFPAEEKQELKSRCIVFLDEEPS